LTASKPKHYKGRINVFSSHCVIVIAKSY